MGALKKKEKRVLGPMFNSSLVKRGLVVSLIVVPLKYDVNLISGFWGHDKSYESNHFLEQRRMMMTTTPTSTCNKTMKVKRPREGGFCVIKLFCGGFFFSFAFLSSPKKDLSPKNWLLPTN